MIIGFEGLDGVGKTALVSAVSAALADLPEMPPVMVMAEFSDGPPGQRLLRRLEDDKFLRPTPFTVENIESLVDDLTEDLRFSLALAEERLPGCSNSGNSILLFDRYVDSIESSEGAMLELAGLSRSEARAVLRPRLAHIPAPALTYLVRTSENQRLGRLRRRGDHPDDARILDEDVRFFDLVGSWLFDVEREGRASVLLNDDGMLPAVTAAVTRDICVRVGRSSR